MDSILKNKVYSEKSLCYKLTLSDLYVSSTRLVHQLDIICRNLCSDWDLASIRELGTPTLNLPPLDRDQMTLIYARTSVWTCPLAPSCQGVQCILADWSMLSARGVDCWGMDREGAWQPCFQLVNYPGLLTWVVCTGAGHGLTASKMRVVAAGIVKTVQVWFMVWKYSGHLNSWMCDILFY